VPRRKRNVSLPSGTGWTNGKTPSASPCSSNIAELAPQIRFAPLLALDAANAPDDALSDAFDLAHPGLSGPRVATCFVTVSGPPTSGVHAAFGPKPTQTPLVCRPSNGSKALARSARIASIRKQSGCFRAVAAKPPESVSHFSTCLRFCLVEPDQPGYPGFGLHPGADRDATVANEDRGAHHGDEPKHRYKQCGGCCGGCCLKRNQSKTVSQGEKP
jgi:hypothetical protein